MRASPTPSTAARPDTDPPSPSPKRRNRYERVLRLAMQAGDLLIINLAFVAAYYLRYVAGVGGDVAEENFVPLETYLPLQAGFTLTLYAVFRVAGIYREPTKRPLFEEAWSILLSTSFGMMALFALVFLIRGFAYSRGLFLFAWVLVVLLLVLARIAARLLRAALRRRGIGVRRVVVVGGDQLGMAVMHVLATQPGLDYRLEGFVQNGSLEDLGRFKCLGTLADLPQLLPQRQVDEVIIALPSASYAAVTEITETCTRSGVGFKIVPDLFQMSLSQVDVEDLRGIPVVGLRELTIQGVDLVAKRALDVLVSALLIAMAAPAWLLIALLIRLDSPGPVFFRQTRLGKDGRPFQALKFRSMRADAETLLTQLLQQNEADGPIFKIRQDPRITRFGRLLRRTSLDELPQLWNVLKGEMSLVGPRPPLESEVEKYEDWHVKRLKVAPGMTGLWQVSGRSELPFDEMVLLDIYYIENWSLALDFEILLRTLPAVLSGRGAY